MFSTMLVLLEQLDTLREVQHLSDEGLALQARV